MEYTPNLRILADENIPLAEEAFSTLGTVRCVPGRRLTAADARDADVLLIRSVTSVGPALLAGSRVRFVGSATTGIDHVDRAYLKQADIAFAHAPGANADSVADYMVAVLLTLAARRGVSLRGRTVGIIGCGHVGGRLARRLPALGLHVLKNDPSRAEAEGPRGFTVREDLLAEADVVTLHVPLTRSGPHATHHLIGGRELERMQPSAWLVNTSRGAVVDNEALDAVLSRPVGSPGATALDVWEGEPTPDPDLLRRVALGTPHVAGYAHDGKVEGTAALYRALCRHLGRPEAWDSEAVLALASAEALALTPPAAGRGETAWLHALTEQMYDVAADDARLRRILQEPPEARGACFSRLRRDYPRRRAFARHMLPAAAVPPAAVPPAYRAAVEDGLGVRLVG